MSDKSFHKVKMNRKPTLRNLGDEPIVSIVKSLRPDYAQTQRKKYYEKTNHTFYDQYSNELKHFCR